MTPELSVIVPVLNEVGTLPELLATLARQREIRFELLICDGGSTDLTVEMVRRHSGDLPYPVRVVTSGRGRALQMNAGAAAGSGRWLLFLHADSLFTDSLALRTGLDALSAAVRARGDDRVAGRYRLRFHRPACLPSWGFYHFECKARLDRPECIHGDQGFLLSRSFFQHVGPFDPALPMLSETRLAETIRTTGQWILLPAELHTSARRFLTEGLYERQVLNAILMNFAALAWHDFFQDFAASYPSHDQSGRIRLAPQLRRIGRLIAALPLKRRLSLWHRTGAYVRSHAWQIPFMIDTRRSFRRGAPPGEGATPALHFYDRHLDRYTDNRAGRLAAAALTWVWFLLVRLDSASTRND